MGWGGVYQSSSQGTYHVLNIDFQLCMLIPSLPPQIVMRRKDWWSCNGNRSTGGSSSGGGPLEDAADTHSETNGDQAKMPVIQEGSGVGARGG